MVGIFGTNASGKSNIIKALIFAADAVRESPQRWLPEEGVPRWPFQLDEQSGLAPSRPDQAVKSFLIYGWYR